MRKGRETMIAEDGNGDSEICRLSAVDVKKVITIDELDDIFGTVIWDQNVNWRAPRHAYSAIKNSSTFVLKSTRTKSIIMSRNQGCSQKKLVSILCLLSFLSCLFPASQPSCLGPLNTQRGTLTRAYFYKSSRTLALQCLSHSLLFRFPIPQSIIQYTPINALAMKSKCTNVSSKFFLTRRVTQRVVWTLDAGSADHA